MRQEGSDSLWTPFCVLPVWAGWPMGPMRDLEPQQVSYKKLYQKVEKYEIKKLGGIFGNQ